MTNRYRCIIATEASFSLAPDLVLDWTFEPGPTGPAKLKIFTEYEDRGFSSKVPKLLRIECELNGSTLQEAVGASETLAAFFVPIFGFVANAAYQDPAVLLAYDVSSGKEDHDLQYHHLWRKTDAALNGSRKLPEKLAEQAVEAVIAHPHAIRLHRALVHYGEALSHWAEGKELRAVEALYIASEVLAPIARDSALVARSVEDLKALWKDVITPRKCPSCAHTWVPDGSLDGAAVRKVIFDDNHALLKQARQISDGLEHGFRDFPEMQRLSKECRDDLARQIRKGMVSLLGGDLAGLLADPYAKPKREDPLRGAHYMQLHGPHDQLAPAGSDDPRFSWQAELTDSVLEPDGTTHMKWKGKLDADLGPGVECRNVSFATGSRSKDLSVTDVQIIPKK